MSQDSDASLETKHDDGLRWDWRVPYRVFVEEWIASGFMADHWEEAGTFRDVLTLDIDHHHYRGLDIAGLLDILVVRGADGRMVGYAILVKQRYSRDRQATAGWMDMMYVRPDHRGKGLMGGLGWRMMKAAVEYLRASGTTLAFFRDKDGSRAILERLGFQPLSTTWGKVLNPPRRDN